MVRRWQGEGAYVGSGGRMGRPLGVLLFVSVVRHAVPIMTRRRPCCRLARVGRDWVCEARGTGIETVVQTNTANRLAGLGLGWVCCAVLLLLLLLLHNVKRVDSSFPPRSYSAHCALPGRCRRR